MDLKTLLKYLIISLVQGFTEPLPISSSGHMKIISNLLNINNTDLTLEIFLNFASMIAIFIYIFKNRLNFKKTFLDFTLIIKVVIASIPCIIIGFFFKDYIALITLNNLFIGITLIITSILLIVSSISINKTKTSNITNKNAFFLGISQSLALIPGISRMGVVLTSGLIQKVHKRSVLDFSFLMYIIVSFGSLILSIKDLMNINYTYLFYYLISFITTFIITFFSVKWFYNIINKKTLTIFSLYTLIVGIILIILGV